MANGEFIRAASLALAEAIQDLGSVPSGELFVRVNAFLDIHQYNAAIDVLVTGGLVRRESTHLLVWIGPPKGA